MSIKPKITRDLNCAKVHFCFKFGNLTLDRWWMMAWTSSKYGNFFTFKLNLTLKLKVNYPLKTIGILTKVLCSSGQNMAILVWTSDKLSHGQASGYHTHRRTDIQMQAMTIPEGRNWPRVKNVCSHNWYKYKWLLVTTCSIHFHIYFLNKWYSTSVQPHPKALIRFPWGSL